MSESDVAISVLKDSLESMEKSVAGPLHCKYLPAYADFLLREKLRAFATLQLELIRAQSIPIFKHFEFKAENELIENGIEIARKLLQYFAQNKGQEFIDHSINAWLSNQIPGITNTQLTPEDISKVNFVRRKLFREFLSSFTTDLEIYKTISEEVDNIFTSLESTTLDKLFQLHQELYIQAQAIAQLGNWVMDVRTNKIIWSDEIFNIYEIDPQPTEGLDLAGFNHPDDKEMVKENMKLALINKGPFDFYYRIIVKNGKEKYLHAKGTVQVDERGEPSSVMGTLRDATQQRQVETDINNKENFIRKITNLTPAIIAAYDIRNGKYLFINEAFKKLLGYDPDEVIEKGAEFFINLIHPDDLKHVTEENAKRLAFANQPLNINNDEVMVEFQCRIKHKKGHYRWFHTYGTVFTRDKNNMVQEVLNISTDITEQIQQSIELQNNNIKLARSEERYHKMTEEVEDYAILLLDKNGIIENWTKGAEKIKGYRAEEIIGKHFSVFYTPEDQQANLPNKLIQEAREYGKATHEGWRSRKNGDRFWGYIVITALKDQNNEIFGFSKVTRDLTEKRLAEQQLRDYADTLRVKNKELEQINKELESFTFMASHDLQEPLRKIKTFSNFILSRELQNLSDSGKDYFNRIVSGTDRMQHLIEALLNFSRIGLGIQTFETLDLNSVIEEVRGDLSDLILSKKAVIESSSLPTIQGDRIQLLQLFFNLFTNSLKYSREGVVPLIEITSEIVPANDIFDNHEDGYCHKINFSDNGIGFEQQYADRIFKLFQRLHGKMEYSGTGIGLAICKKIVLNHGGIINASGEPGKGAIFTIYLPFQ